MAYTGYNPEGGHGINSEENPKKTSAKKPKAVNEPKAKGKRFPGYYDIPNAKPYKRNSDGSVQMITTKGSTFSLRKGTDK